MASLGDNDNVLDSDFEGMGAWIVSLLFVVLSIFYIFGIFIIGTPIMLIIFVCRWIKFTFIFGAERGIEHAVIATKFILYFKDVTNPVTKPPFEDSDYPL